MRQIYAALISLSLFAFVAAQEPPLKVIASEAKLVSGAANFITIGDRVYLRNLQDTISYVNVGLIRVQTEAKNVEVTVSDKDRDPVEVESIAPEYYEINKRGKFWVDVIAIDFDKNIYGRKQKVLTVTGRVDPDPPEPDDPDVDPDDPDDPDPPRPPPIDVDGLHVLIVYESDQASQMKPGHREIFYSQASRSFLNSVAGANWRILDKDSQFTTDSKWNRALKRPRESLPWIIISNGVTGYEGRLPNNLAELKGMIEIYIP